MVDQLSDEMVSYRTRKTVLEILRDRGYEINDNDINQSLDDFKDNLLSKPSQNFIAKREVSNGAMGGEEDGAGKTKMEPIFVVFATDVEKIGRETINKVITTME
jgi:DNA-directed RNA polymerases I, II, and III subunit RPABC1